MMGYFQNLLEKLAAIDIEQKTDDLNPVDYEREIVIGIATDIEIKQMHFYLYKLLKECDEIIKNHDAMCDGNHCDQHTNLNAKADKIFNEINLAREMLKFLLRSQFTFKDGYDGIALRQGWQVVCINDKPKDSGFIAIMFGPGV